MALEPRAQLLARLAGMGGAERVPARFSLPREFAQALGDQDVLGREVPIKRHLVGARRLRDLLDPDRSDALLDRTVRARPTDAVARRQALLPRTLGSDTRFAAGFVFMALDKRCYR